jgi:hypothetical protein
MVSQLGSVERGKSAVLVVAGIGQEGAKDAKKIRDKDNAETQRTS